MKIFISPYQWYQEKLMTKRTKMKHINLTKYITVVKTSPLRSFYCVCYCREVLYCLVE